MTMSSADNKTLLITVANEASGHMNAASGGSGGGSTSEKDKKDKEEDKKGNKKSLNKLIGIDISLAAMLKQSQIFTGFLGSVFQLIGMLVDVILAPLAPYLFKLVEIVASWIPKIAQWSEAAVNWAKDGLDHLADISSLLTGVNVSASDLVSKGFQLVSLSGFGALIGSSFAAKVGGIGDWKLTDFFDDVFSNDDVLNPIKNSLKSVGGVAGKMLTGFKALFSAIMGEAIIGIGKRLIAITKPVLRALGIVGLIASLVITIADFKTAWDEGEIGKALVELAIAIVVIGVPMIIGLFFGGWVALIAAIALSVLAMFYEYGVDEATKSTIEAYVANMWGELGDTFNEWFAGEDGFGKFIKGFLFLAQPLMHLDVLAGIFMTEAVKQTINESLRNMADDIVNGLIRMINFLITSVLQPFQQSSLGQAMKANPLLNAGGWLNDDFNLIPEKDFSNWTPMLGSQTPDQYDMNSYNDNPWGNGLV
jgi:hypothetical protein